MSTVLGSIPLLILSLFSALSGLSLVTIIGVSRVGEAYAHFIGGETKTIDKYQVLFPLTPPKPVVDDNSTKLNFSILDTEEDSADVKLIFAALTIKEKNTENIIYQVPYKLYEFGDITFPYTFRINTDFEAILQARISGDPKYETTPLTARKL